MSVTIAGRTVKVGDPLYHTSFQAWGTVKGFDGDVAKLEIIGANGRSRTLYVQTGGIVNGKTVVKWHKPLELNLPYQDITKIQRVLDAIVSEFA